MQESIYRNVKAGKLPVSFVYDIEGLDTFTFRTIVAIGKAGLAVATAVGNAQNAHNSAVLSELLDGKIDAETAAARVVETPSVSYVCRLAAGTRKDSGRKVATAYVRHGKPAASLDRLRVTADGKLEVHAFLTREEAKKAGNGAKAGDAAWKPAAHPEAGQVFYSLEPDSLANARKAKLPFVVTVAGKPAAVRSVAETIIRENQDTE